MMAVKATLFCLGSICALAFIACLFKYYKPHTKDIFDLIFRSGIKSGIVNMLTMYRIIVSPILLLLLFNDSPLFKWIILSALATDALDGFLARRFKVVSKLGAKLDSFADDLLFIVCLVSLISFHYEVITENIFIVSSVIFMFVLKIILLYLKHNKIISGMHTYLTKAAAFLQAIFFMDLMFHGPDYFLFYSAAVCTIISIAEEIIIIVNHKELKQDVKGLFLK